MLEQYYAVIMAGGGGTRLWPFSRQARPKQLLRLFGQQTLFQIAVQRLEGLFPPERVLVVTVAAQAADLQAQAPQIPVENFLLEPLPRGTASVVALAAAALARRDPHAIMAVLTADHFIQDVQHFHRLLRGAREIAVNDYLVTLGITPTHPATGYGYIRFGTPMGEFQGLPAFHVERFVEKPDRVQAEGMVADNQHAWNSGMFVWRVERIQSEFQRQMPDLARRMDVISQGLGTPQEEEILGREWPQLKSETIDYGVMEAAEQVAVLPAEGLGWSDVGSWDSLFELLPSDDHGNIIVRGEHISIDSQRVLLFHAGESRPVVTIGVEDLVVVDTGDVLLICDRGRAQDVRAVVNLMKETNRDGLL